jgi:FkbM family methyltransferase
MLAANADAPDLLGDAVAALIESNPKPFFVQVGGFDGVSFDPLRRQIVDKNLSGLIVEPIPQYFEKLTSLYAGSTSVTPVNCAITEENGERTIWRFNPVAVERGLLPPHFAGISSFLMDDLLKETGVLGRSSPNAETTAALRSLLQPVTVQCRTMESLLAEYGVEKIDILQIDTEGYDYIILKLFDFGRYQPEIVHYEHQHLNMADRAAAESLLRSHGYELHRNAYDTLAVLDPTRHRAPSQLRALRDLAMLLHAEGRTKDALLLLEHLAAVEPGNAETLRPLVKMLSAEGRTLDAIKKLVELKSATTDMEALLGDIQGHAPAAVQCFNDHLAANEVEEAERYASALVALIPRNMALLEAALSCNLALGRKGKAAKYAATLLSLDAAHATARSLLAECSEKTNDADGEIEHRMALALAPKSDLHPLVRLRDIHDVASAILCAPLTSRGVEQIEQLLKAARELEISVPAGSEWEGWQKHYRLMLDSVDLRAVQGETPEIGREPKIGLMTSSGVPLNWLELRATAARLGAEAVFFAAADRAYVDLYARWYIKSILKHCDVPCLVILHVIGGAGHLREVVKSVGVRDKRLIFTSDRFDAGGVTTRCYDTPPKGLIAKPVAHLQSIRFLRLGSFLQKLKLPVFVSDIDLLLQRGVKDLLQRSADADVVFNENTQSTNAGSRLTANLLLVNPTHNAALFLRFLRSYLERALSKSEVTRWIDQFALMLARHHLCLRANNPRIGYFDTNTDINNVMYKSYQEHPFRFLSLYHGFDTSSLEDNPKVLGETPKRTRAARPAKRTLTRRKRRSGSARA